MGAPQTLPANFDGWDKPPDTLPKDFNQWDQSKATTPSAASRLGTNLLSGLGVTSNEQAKNFFVHPLDTVIKSFEAQGELAKKAREAYRRGDYMGALQHGLNYLVPFVGQQTDQAGEQLKEGDIAGGIGRTLGATVPIAAGSPEVQSAAGDAASVAASAGAKAVRATARGVNKGLEAAPGTIGGSIGATIGGKVAGYPGAGVGAIAGEIAGKEILPKLRIPGEGFGLPSRVTGGPKTIPPEVEDPAIEPAPGDTGGPSAPQPGPTAPAATATATDNVPRTGNLGSNFNGESALRDVLSRQDNANLLKIARSRGINVTQEQSLKPSAIVGGRTVSDNLINKIVDNFSDDELENMRSTYLENYRSLKFGGAVGDQESWRGKIGAEANKTLSLETFFPDVKIPKATLRRTQSAVTTAKTIPDSANAPDLLNVLKESLKRVQQQKSATQATP